MNLSMEVAVLWPTSLSLSLSIPVKAAASAGNSVIAVTVASVSLAWCETVRVVAGV